MNFLQTGYKGKNESWMYVIMFFITSQNQEIKINHSYARRSYTFMHIHKI